MLCEIFMYNTFKWNSDSLKNLFYHKIIEKHVKMIRTKVFSKLIFSNDREITDKYHIYTSLIKLYERDFLFNGTNTPFKFRGPASRLFDI